MFGSNKVEQPKVLAPNVDDTINEATWILGDLIAECMPFHTEDEEDALCEKAARMAMKLRRALQRECQEPQ